MFLRRIKTAIRHILNHRGYDIDKLINKKPLINRIITFMGYDIRRLFPDPDVSDINMYINTWGAACLVKKPFYNIGAGTFWHPAWTNMDYESKWYSSSSKYTRTGITYDLLSMSPFPIETNSANVVYSSHTVEHISDQAAQNMFNEAHRILKKGGVMRITTPDIDLYFRAYKNKDRSFYFWMDLFSTPSEVTRIKLAKPMNEASDGEIFLYQFASSVSPLHADGAQERIMDIELENIFTEKEYEDALNYCTAKCPLEIQKKYPGNHINWWNKNKLMRMLKNAGFTDVFPSGYGQSSCPILRNTHYFDNTHPKISLYVEAVK